MPRSKMEKPNTSPERRIQKHFGSGQVIPPESPAIVSARAAQRSRDLAPVQLEPPEADQPPRVDDQPPPPRVDDQPPPPRVDDQPPMSRLDRALAARAARESGAELDDD